MIKGCSAQYIYATMRYVALTLHLSDESDKKVDGIKIRLC